MNEYLVRLKQKRDLINNRIQAAEARAKNTNRKQDVRRKILVGAYYLEQASKENTMDNIKKIMNEFLTRNNDRKLFDLPELADSKTKPMKNE